MPLYKSLTVKLPTKSEGPEKQAVNSFVDNYEIAKKKRDEINAQIQKSVTEFKEKLKTSLEVAEKEKAQLPAPGLAHPISLSSGPSLPLSSSQFSSSAVLKAPPQLPMANNFPQTIHRISSNYETLEAPPPPTISSNTTSIVGAPLLPKKAKPQQPGAAAPGKTDALHKDFQDALDIIFPSENVQKNEQDNRNVQSQQPDPNFATGDPNMHSMMQHMPPNMMGGYPNMPGAMPPGYPIPYMDPNMMPPNMDHSSMGPNMGPNSMGMNSMGSNQMGSNHMAMMPPGHMDMMMGYNNYPGGIYPPGSMYEPMPLADQPLDNQQTSRSKKKTQEMEDMAMLGIDAEDVGASGF